jgi:hypothetical protein
VPVGARGRAAGGQGMTAPRTGASHWLPFLRSRNPRPLPAGFERGRLGGSPTCKISHLSNALLRRHGSRQGPIVRQRPERCVGIYITCININTFGRAVECQLRSALLPTSHHSYMLAYCRRHIYIVLLHRKLMVPLRIHSPDHHQPH